MKKIITMLIVAVFLLSGCAAFVTPEEYELALAERDTAITEKENAMTEKESLALKVQELQTANSSLSEENKALAQLISELTSEAPSGSEYDIIIYESIGKSISENATTSLLRSDVVQTIIPSSEGELDTIRQQIIDYVWAVVSALSSDENAVQTYTIMVVNNKGQCLFGYSINEDGTTATFISDLYPG